MKEMRQSKNKQSRLLPLLLPVRLHTAKTYFMSAMLCCSIAISAQGNINTILTEYDLGAWAYKQHNDICSKIYPALEKGSLIPYSGDNKSMDKGDARKVFATMYVVFISTDPDDPTVGKDTTDWVPIIQNFHSFIISDKYIGIMVGKASKTVQFDKVQFHKLLSGENLAYFQKYTRNNKVVLNDIPLISNLIVTDINLRLLTESRKNGTELYKTDSLLSKFSEQDKQWRGKPEVIVFIPTDPDDPTIGKDSIYVEEMVFPDTAVSQGLFFALKTDHLKMEIIAVGLGFHPRFGDFTGRLIPFGFLKYDRTSLIISDEKKLLEYCLWFSIQEKLGIERREYDKYIDTLRIKVKI